VAILIDHQATLIDFAGLWQALVDAQPGGQDAAFDVYAVAPDLAASKVYGNLIVTPNYTFENAPAPDILAMGAQTGVLGASSQKLAWIRKTHATTRVTATVCTGAFILAQTGLLDGLEATTHHQFFDALQQHFPKIKVVRDRRIVEQGRIVTAGGESCAIDLGLWLVRKFYGEAAAIATADYMEFQGRSWLT
jgi:transcriptional regulator GlxA family with amidase domain